MNIAVQKVLTLGHVGMGTGEVAPFDALYENGLLVTPDDIKAGKIDALIIWGGGDISPTIYNEPLGPRTGAGIELSHRDRVEVEACRAAIEMNIPIIGICRGAQLLCALAGGKLVQDVSGHAGSDHSIDTNKGHRWVTSSVHHQMMYPWDIEHELIAWSTENRSRDYLGVDARRMQNILSVDEVWGGDQPDYIEPEIVYFPKIKGLAIQGHPEFMRPNDPFVKYCLILVQEYLM